MTQELINKVKVLVSEQVGTEHHLIKDEHTLTHDLGADSLDVLELSLTLEDEFNVEIPDDYIYNNTLTVIQLAQYIADNQR